MVVDSFVPLYSIRTDTSSFDINSPLYGCNTVINYAIVEHSLPSYNKKCQCNHFMTLGWTYTRILLISEIAVSYDM